MNNIETGKIGEDIANKYLLNNGYLILARNHRERFDEIDIIARRKDGLLIFCEVKTINREGYLSNLCQKIILVGEKLKKIIRASSLFLARHPGRLYEGSGWQIDLIAIVLKNGKLADLRHYENL